MNEKGDEQTKEHENEVLGVVESLTHVGASLRPEALHVPVEGDEEEQPSCHPSHFRDRKVHSVLWRFGVPVYLLSTLGLLFASHIGSGVAAEYTLYFADGTEFEQKVLFNASIFTSVQKLWDSGSYVLAILIVITSIMWPYLKLIFTFCAWVLPYKSERRREHLLEIVDVLGKLSFVDIFVMLIIMVAFRATIPTGLGTYMEVVVVPRWGFFGFVLATMLSLVGTQVVLYKHRCLVYKDIDVACRTEDEEDVRDELVATHGKRRLATVANIRAPRMLLLLVITLALVIVGCIIDIFEVVNDQAGEILRVLYSVLKVGYRLPSAALEPNDLGVRWIQAMYYFLGFALPIWSLPLFGLLYMAPMTALWHRRILMLAEITFSWSSIEVLMICVIFSVLQIPTFGNGLIESGCDSCYIVSSSIFPEFAALAVGAGLHVGISVWLYRKAHSTLYPSTT